MKQFFKKLLNYSGRHYRMERFTILFFIFLFLFSVNLVFSYHSKIKHDRQLISDDAIYTQNFRTSKTNISGSVVDVFSSDDYKKVFLLLSFSDLGAISTDSNNYQMFLTAANVSQNPLTFTEPKATIYSFGSTGYFGVYFEHPTGFEKQIMQLTFRCNSELIKPQDVSSRVNEDKSFDKYDQFVINFNPGAKNTTKMACLNQDSIPSYKEIYNEAIITKEETVIRGELNTLLDKLRIDINAIAEYEQRLKGQWALNVPVLPDSIAGDKVEGSAADDNLRLITNYVFATGFDYDWRGGSVASGYMDKLKRAGQSDEAFLAEKNTEQKFDTFQTSKLEWTFLDGSPLQSIDVGSTGGKDRYSKVRADIERYLRSWQVYREDKKMYQTQKLRELLLLEMDLRSIEGVTNTNSSDSNLICY